MKSIFQKLFGSSEERAAKEEEERLIHQAEEKKKIQELLEEKGSVELRLQFSSRKGYVALIHRDEFTADITIKFKQVASYVNDKLMTWADDGFCPFYIGFRFERGENYLTIAVYQKEIRIKEGDKFSLLLANGEVANYKIVEKGYRIDKDTDGVIIESRIPISMEDVQKLCEFEVQKWRYSPVDGIKIFTGTLKMETQNDMAELTSAYLELVEKFIKLKN
jgi:hypothetical protein